MRPPLIGLTGYAQVGKDSVAHVLAQIGYRTLDRMPPQSAPFEPHGRDVASADAPAIVVDVATAAEAQRIRGRGGLIWRVIRPGFGPADRADEERLAQMRPDETVCNTGSLDQLDGVVRYMIARWQDPLELNWCAEPAGPPVVAVGSEV